MGPDLMWCRSEGEVVPECPDVGGDEAGAGADDLGVWRPGSFNPARRTEIQRLLSGGLHAPLPMQASRLRASPSSTRIRCSSAYLFLRTSVT